MRTLVLLVKIVVAVFLIVPFVVAVVLGIVKFVEHLARPFKKAKQYTEKELKTWFDELKAKQAH